MREIDRCREAFEKAGHDRMDFWSVWCRAWKSRARSDAKKNRDVHFYLRLEREAHRQYVEEKEIEIGLLKAKIALTEETVEELNSEVTAWRETASTYEDFYRKTQDQVDQFCDLADQRAKGYANRENGNVLNGRLMDKVCKLAEEFDDEERNAGVSDPQSVPQSKV